MLPPQGLHCLSVAETRVRLLSLDMCEYEFIHSSWSSLSSLSSQIINGHETSYCVQLQMGRSVSGLGWARLHNMPTRFAIFSLQSGLPTHLKIEISNYHLHMSSNYQAFHSASESSAVQFRFD